VENIFGLAGLAEQVTNSSRTAHFPSNDALGSIRLITDGSGNVVGTGSHSAWGTPDSGSVTLNGFGFTGEQVRPETGFVYLRNRYLDPAAVRFLTPDLWALPGAESTSMAIITGASWEHLAAVGVLVSTVPVKSVEFVPSKRRTIAVSVGFIFDVKGGRRRFVARPLMSDEMPTNLCPFCWMRHA
jgi:RHS repeat-associated protein